jgi:hypothetical protein
MITVISTHQFTTRRKSFPLIQTTKSNVLLPLSIMFLLLFVTSPIEPIMCFTIGGERLPTRLLGRTSTKSNGSSYSSALLRNSNPSLTDVGVNHGVAFSNNSKNNIVESPLYSDDHAVDDYLEFLDRRYRYVILKKGVFWCGDALLKRFPNLVLISYIGTSFALSVPMQAFT